MAPLLSADVESREDFKPDKHITTASLNDFGILKEIEFVMQKITVD